MNNEFKCILISVQKLELVWRVWVNSLISQYWPSVRPWNKRTCLWRRFVIFLSLLCRGCAKNRRIKEFSLWLRIDRFTYRSSAVATWCCTSFAYPWSQPQYHRWHEWANATVQRSGGQRLHHRLNSRSAWVRPFHGQLLGLHSSADRSRKVTPGNDWRLGKEWKGMAQKDPRVYLVMDEEPKVIAASSDFYCLIMWQLSFLEIFINNFFHWNSKDIWL